MDIAFVILMVGVSFFLWIYNGFIRSTDLSILSDDTADNLVLNRYAAQVFQVLAARTYRRSVVSGVVVFIIGVLILYPEARGPVWAVIEIFASNAVIAILFAITIAIPLAIYITRWLFVFPFRKSRLGFWELESVMIVEWLIAAWLAYVFLFADLGETGSFFSILLGMLIMLITIARLYIWFLLRRYNITQLNEPKENYIVVYVSGGVIFVLCWLAGLDYGWTVFVGLIWFHSLSHYAIDNQWWNFK